MKKRCDNAPSIDDISTFARGCAILSSKFEQMPVMRLGLDDYEAYFRKCAPAKAMRLADVLSNSTEMSYDGGRKHVFAKQEALLKSHGAQPRIVYQGTDMYNCLVGTVVDKLSKRMKEVFSLENPRNSGNTVLYAPGVSSDRLADIITSRPGEAVESDFKNNDGSQSGVMRKYEALFYKKLGAPLWFVREFAKQTSINVWTRYGISARLEGQRWSGEGPTTTGNSFVGMAIMCASIENAGIQESTNVHGGDDYLGLVSRGSSGKLAQHILEDAPKCGMRAEVVLPPRDHATFYRKRYIRDSNGGHPIPQFGRVLAKLNIRANYNTNISDADYMAGKYMSAAYEHRHVPIVGKMLLESGTNMSKTPYFDDRVVKINEMGGKEGITLSVANAKVAEVGVFDEWLNVLYGCNLADLVSVYSSAADSVIDYLEGWVVKNSISKKCAIGKPGYQAHILDNEVTKSLIRCDVAP